MKIDIATHVYTVCRTAEPIVRQGVAKAGEVDWNGERLLIDGTLTAGPAWETLVHEVLEAFETHIPPPEDREKRVDWTGTIKAMMAAAMAEITVDLLMALPADASPSASPPILSDVRLKTSKFAHLSPDQFEVAKHLWTKYGLDPWDNDFHVILVPTRDGLEVRLCQHQQVIERIARDSDAWGGCDAAAFDYDDGDFPSRCTVTVYRVVGGERMPFTTDVSWRECFGNDVEQLPEVVRNKPEACLEARGMVKIMRRAFGVPLFLKEEFDSPRGERRRPAVPAPEPVDDTPQSADGMHGLLAERYGLSQVERKKLIGRTALTFGDRTDGDEVRFYRAVIAAADAAWRKTEAVKG